MKKADVKVGVVYAVKVSGKVVPVRLTREGTASGWFGRNEVTGREVRIRSAAKLRAEVRQCKQCRRWTDRPEFCFACIRLAAPSAAAP